MIAHTQHCYLPEPPVRTMSIYLFPTLINFSPCHCFCLYAFVVNVRLSSVRVRYLKYQMADERTPHTIRMPLTSGISVFMHAYIA